MTAADRDAAARRQRAREIALWRWTLVGPAMDPALTPRQRGAVVRDLAAREHDGPDGRKKVSVSRRTLDRWVVARRDGGFEALMPEPRQCAPRTDADVVELAVGLKLENPARTASQVRRILIARLGWAPSDRAIQRWFAARELVTRPGGQPPEAFGRFQADAVNEIWTADLMNGPDVAGPATWPASSMTGPGSWPVPGSSAARTRCGSPRCCAPPSRTTASPGFCTRIMPRLTLCRRT